MNAYSLIMTKHLLTNKRKKKLDFLISPKKWIGIKVKIILKTQPKSEFLLAAHNFVIL